MARSFVHLPIVQASFSAYCPQRICQHLRVIGQCWDPAWRLSQERTNIEIFKPQIFSKDFIGSKLYKAGNFKVCDKVGYACVDEKKVSRLSRHRRRDAEIILPPHSKAEISLNLLTYPRSVKRHLVSGRAPVINMNEACCAVAAEKIRPDSGRPEIRG